MNKSQLSHTLHLIPVFLIVMLVASCSLKTYEPLVFKVGRLIVEPPAGPSKPVAIHLKDGPLAVPKVDEAGNVTNAEELIPLNVIFGTPIASSPVTILENLGYTSAYCNTTRTPLWVGYRLFGTGDFESGRRPSNFSTDGRVTNSPVHRDYTNTGYDRGHMAPNAPVARRYGPVAQRSTFLMTNVAPQLPELNQGTWEDLESLISNRWAPAFTEVWVYVGPVFDDIECWELPSGIRIPSHCYMIIIDIDDEDGRVHALGVIMPQEHPESAPLSNYVVPISEIEARTGINFLHELENADYLINLTEPDPRWAVETHTLTPTRNPRPINRQRCDEGITVSLIAPAGF